MSFQAVLARGSKSFRLASLLLPAHLRHDAAVVYAWCRRVDDAIDESPRVERPFALHCLRTELDEIYGEGDCADETAAAFQEVVRRCHIPRSYPEELLAGMAMDVYGRRYQSVDDLVLYCWRVAGTVGLMMCHVMEVSDAGALRRAAHLGIAMQLTNICRDVEEDWRDGRLYLPADLLPERAWRELPPDPVLAPAIQALLTEANRFYRSGDGGIGALRWRCALAIRVARRVYAAIGGRIARRGFGVHTGRVVVSRPRKLALVAGAAARSLVFPPRFRPAELPLLRFPDDVLPL